MTGDQKKLGAEYVVVAYTLLDGDELKVALDSDADIELGHPAYAADHRWTLKAESFIR